MTYTDSLLILGGLLSGGLGILLLVFVLRSWLGERRRQRELQIAMNVLKFLSVSGLIVKPMEVNDVVGLLECVHQGEKKN